MEIKKIITDFHKELETSKNKDKAKWEKKYLKSPFKFYGSKRGSKEKIVKNFKKRYFDINKTNLWRLVERLWQDEYHDMRRLAVKILKVYVNLLNKSDLPRLQKFLNSSMNWDEVDEISIHLVGEVLKTDFNAGKKYLLKWSRSDNFWLRRASMLSQLKLFKTRYGDKKLFFELAKKMMDESKYNDKQFTSDIFDPPMGKFFIRKCIGWVLREMSKSDPQAVVKFVNQNKSKMSGLSYREAIKRLPDQYQSKLS